MAERRLAAVALVEERAGAGAAVREGRGGGDRGEGQLPVTGAADLDVGGLVARLDADHTGAGAAARQRGDLATDHLAGLVDAVGPQAVAARVLDRHVGGLHALGQLDYLLAGAGRGHRVEGAVGGVRPVGRRAAGGLLVVLRAVAGVAALCAAVLRAVVGRVRGRG